MWPSSVQCRVLGVSMSGYHEHFVRRASDAQRRHLSDDALLVHIKAMGYGFQRQGHFAKQKNSVFKVPDFTWGAGIFR